MTKTTVAVKAKPKAKMEPAAPLFSAAPTSMEAGIIAAGAPKNFRNQPDIENFFRFIYENDLREEGLEILNAVMLKKEEKRAAKKAAN